MALQLCRVARRHFTIKILMSADPMLRDDSDALNYARRDGTYKTKVEEPKAEPDSDEAGRRAKRFPNLDV